MQKILLFDIGGTNMRFGLSPDGKKLESERIVPTPQNYIEGLKSFQDVTKEVLAGVIPEAVVGGIAGSLTADKGTIYNSPHLPDWSKREIKKDLSAVFSCPVYLENDTALVGLGEATQGAGKAYSIVAYVTISTGVNGVKIEDKRISKSVMGYEIGHQLIDYNAATSDVEYGKGELEDFVGGAAIQKRKGLEANQINDEEFWSKTSRFLSIGLFNTVLHWSPEILILGGAITNKISFNELRVDLSERLSQIYPQIPMIEKGILGEFGGLHGALVYASQQ